MQVTLSTTTDPNDIITLADIKSHLRITHDLEDGLLTGIRAAAINYVQNYANVQLGSVTAYGYMPAFVASYIPIGPVTAISAVEYETDNDGTLQTMPSADWHVDTRTRPARISFSDIPSPYEYAMMPIRVTMTVGHAEDAIPGVIIQAIKMLAAHLYENRQDEVVGTITSRVKLGLDALLAGERFIYQP